MLFHVLQVVHVPSPYCLPWKSVLGEHCPVVTTYRNRIHHLLTSRIVALNRDLSEVQGNLSDSDSMLFDALQGFASWNGYIRIRSESLQEFYGTGTGYAQIRDGAITIAKKLIYMVRSNPVNVPEISMVSSLAWAVQFQTPLLKSAHHHPGYLAEEHAGDCSMNGAREREGYIQSYQCGSIGVAARGPCRGSLWYFVLQVGSR